MMLNLKYTMKPIPAGYAN